jgi:hypothetical protein
MFKSLGGFWNFYFILKVWRYLAVKAAIVAARPNYSAIACPVVAKGSSAKPS